jgi:hypothetical protein
VWPDAIEIRYADGLLMRVATRAQALEIVDQGIGEAVGRGTVKYVRLFSITVHARGTNDASRTVISNLPATFKTPPPLGRIAVRPDRNVQNNVIHADRCKHWLDDSGALRR